MISFIVLGVCWGSWVSEPAAADGDIVFTINAGFIFILLIHLIFTLVVYWTEMASRFLLLYIVSVIWLFYTYVLIFFIVSSITRDIGSSASFFFFLRFASMVLVANKCFVGHEILAFKYPNFATEHKKISASGQFIRTVPYVFEIHTILLWMSKKTLVPLMDFFIFRDMNLQLEILIAKQMNPTYGEPPKPLHLRVWGTILLILFGVLCFGPMFFISDQVGSTVLNPPRYSLLEISVGSLPPLYKATGIIAEVTTEEHQQIADSKISSLSFMVWNHRSLISRADFPAFSFQVWRPQGSSLASLSSLLNQSDVPVSLYYIFTLYFDYAATSTPTTMFSWQQSGPALSEGEIKFLIEWLRSDAPIKNTDSLLAISMPLGLIVDLTDPTAETEIRRDVTLVPTTIDGNFELDIRFSGPTSPIPFLNQPDKYRILVWSQSVNAEDWASSISESNAGILGLYILILFTVGALIRSYTMRGIDELWINRMQRPQKLYRMVVATEAYRSAGYLNKEYEMVCRFLQTLRSQEQCLRITSPDSFGHPSDVT
jgi:hypothetical protein